MQLPNALFIGTHDTHVIARKHLQCPIKITRHWRCSNKACSFCHAVAGKHFRLCLQCFTNGFVVEFSTAQKNTVIFSYDTISIMFEQIGQDLIHDRNMGNTKTEHIIQNALRLIALVYDKGVAT